MYEAVTLMVPEGSRSAYEAHEAWRLFKHIETFDPDAAICEVDVDGVGACDVYSLGGVKVAEGLDGLSNGVYIVRQGAKVTKVVI